MRALILVLLLSGCSLLPRKEIVVTVPQAVEVKVAVPVPCIVDTPPRPDLVSDDDLAAMGDYAFVLAIRKNQLALMAYSLELEALLSGCRVAPGV